MPPGFAAKLAVQPWPGPLMPPQDGLIVISSAYPAGTSRPLARESIRRALRAALSNLCELGASDVVLDSVPGQAPRLTLHTSGGAVRAGVSISHIDGLSLAAVNFNGAVGVDLMQVEQAQEFAGWDSVARDYLGPAVARALRASAPAERAIAFAQAWTAREASLKCAGLALSEWTAGSDRQSAACRHHGLALPPGLCATLAVQRPLSDARCRVRN
jgi:4'-phosphopantetheinyl transferase